MKKIYTVLFLVICLTATAQDFDKNLATARSSYSSGKLEDARFALEAMLHDLDMAIGKEILKMLPAQMGALKVNEKQDNLTGAGATGLFVHRTYGADAKAANLEIINNSPMMNSIGAILNTPLLGGMMRNENQSVVKIQGYKSLLNKSVDSDTGKVSYELQIPLNNTLVTLKVNDTTESEITGFGNSIPLAKIAQIAQ
jgi:hypothetical protein